MNQPNLNPKERENSLAPSRALLACSGNGMRLLLFLIVLNFLVKTHSGDAMPCYEIYPSDAVRLLEGDIHPPYTGFSAGGDGTIDYGDVERLQAILSSREPILNQCHFQTCDVYPTNTAGDGVLDLRDFMCLRDLVSRGSIPPVGGPGKNDTNDPLPARGEIQMILPEFWSVKKGSNLSVIVSAPIHVTALSFSLSFNPAHWRPRGTDRSAINTNQIAEGRFGFVGYRSYPMRITFEALIDSPPEFVKPDFLPIPPRICTASGVLTEASYLESVRFIEPCLNVYGQELNTFEGDAFPFYSASRPGGDGMVRMTDWQVVTDQAFLRRPILTPCDFMISDVAPPATGGDGFVNVADVLQIFKWSLDADKRFPMVPLNGPGPSPLGPDSLPLDVPFSLNAVSNHLWAVQIHYTNVLGAAAFALSYDTNQLKYTSLVYGNFPVYVNQRGGRIDLVYLKGGWDPLLRSPGLPTFMLQFEPLTAGTTSSPILEPLSTMGISTAENPTFHRGFITNTPLQNLGTVINFTENRAYFTDLRSYQENLAISYSTNLTDWLPYPSNGVPKGDKIFFRSAPIEASAITRP